MYLTLIFALTAGCNAAPPTTDQKQQQQDAASPANGGLTAKKIDDVWVFIGTPIGTPDERANPSNLKIITTDSRDGGRPTIKNDCLLVGGEVIIWWNDQTETAKRIVGEAKKDPPADVHFRGEGAVFDAPPIVSERCGVDKIRHAGKSSKQRR